MTYKEIGPRPCGRGGFKPRSAGSTDLQRCPRPCGRGGFKPYSRSADCRHADVPAHAGGVDLSLTSVMGYIKDSVPAHAGGVDLSRKEVLLELRSKGPRPCGRGGFKLE